ncbi:helix-turn-helix domain-containing protein, partial [Escherichia coli]
MSEKNPIPERLKEARCRAGLSQRSLGLLVGFDPASASSRMNHYEKGRHVPDIDTLRRIGFAPIFPDICYHLTHYKPAAADIPVASDNPAH